MINGRILNNQKLFTLYNVLKIFLSKNDYEYLTSSLKYLVTKLEDKLNSISVNDILDRMDFPVDWHKQ